MFRIVPLPCLIICPSDKRIFLSLGKNIEKLKKISREKFLKILRNLSEHYGSSKDSLVLNDQEIDQTHLRNINSDKGEKDFKIWKNTVEERKRDSKLLQ